MEMWSGSLNSFLLFLFFNIYIFSQESYEGCVAVGYNSPPRLFSFVNHPCISVRPNLT